MMSLPAVTIFLSIFPVIYAVELKAVKYDLGGVPPNLTGPLEKNYMLTKAERFKVNQLKGPESFAYYKGHIFTGLSDGRVVDISDCGVKTLINLAPPGCVGESQCGRPLGLRIDPMGRLIIADSARGIFRLDLATGALETLYSSDTPVNGKKCKFINDVAIARDGTILFTDSSSKWTRNEFLWVILEGESSGRLLAYSDKSNKTIMVLDNLSFPNGLQFGPQEDFLLIAESGRARIRKLNLRTGTNWLQLTNFAENLPGMPDNIRSSGRGTYWVAMSQSRHDNMTSLVDEYADQPDMRNMVAMMSSMDQILAMSEKYGMIVELNANGEIIRSLQDPTGERVAAVSEVMERDGYLYLGSFDRPYVSRVPLTSKFHVERFLSKIKSTCRAKKINIPKLRMVLRRLVAIAEFRAALLKAKRRQEREKAAAAAQSAQSATTPTPSVLETSSAVTSETTASPTGTGPTATFNPFEGTSPTTASETTGGTESTPSSDIISVTPADSDAVVVVVDGQPSDTATSSDSTTAVMSDVTVSTPSGEGVSTSNDTTSTAVPDVTTGQTTDTVLG